LTDLDKPISGSLQNSKKLIAVVWIE